MPKPYTVYLSSTLNDLKEEREAVKKALEGECVVKESYDAATKELVPSIRDDIKSCDFYIGILGLRYGHVPEVEWNPKRRSITELEYELAGAMEKPRYLYVKEEGGITVPNADRDDPLARIEKFRARVVGEARAARFASVDEIGRLALRALFDFEKGCAPDLTLMQSGRIHPRTLRPDVMVACVRGTDDACASAIRELRDPRFGVVELGLTDSAYLASLDAALSHSRVGCLLVTQKSLFRVMETDHGEKLAAALKMLDDRTPRAEQPSAFLLLDGVKAADVPKEWSFARTVELPADSVTAETKPALERLYSRLRADTSLLGASPAIGLPYVVVALTRDEAVQMSKAPDVAFSGYSEIVRDIRAKQFKEIESVLVAADPAWPETSYGPRRDDWRPLGPRGPTVQELLESVIKRVNQSVPGSREQRRLRGARLQLQRYTFDEFINDRFGSRDNLIAVRERGCLLIIDDLALMQPMLRKGVEALVGGSRSAIVSISPLDPERQAIGTLLEEMSWLKVGTLIDRFRESQDPRCELALHSKERIERWLRFAVPELIASAEELEAKESLVAIADTDLLSS